MQLNVLRELRQRLGSVTTYDIQEQSLRFPEIELVDLTGTLTLLRTDRGILVTFRATTSIEERCARCLQNANCSQDVQFEEEYISVVDAETGARIAGDESEDQFSIGADFVLDLREGIRQYVLLSEPMNPLCRPDCAGLCLRCGADLNYEQCQCAPEPDETWGALASLRKKR